MEHNGALSNPQAKVELSRLADLCCRLRQEAPDNPCPPRALAPRVHTSRLVARVLECADRPMRAREIYAAAQVLAGEQLRWASVRQALSAGVREESRRFERVRHGVYRSLR